MLTGPGTYGSGGPWGPTAVANAFSFPVQSGFNGAGETVAIIIDTAPVTSDLTTYFSYFQTPTTSRTITSEAIDGGAGTGDQFEATLDSETIGGLAPGANIIIYEIPELSDEDINDAANQTVVDGKANVVSMSFGGCEDGYDEAVTAQTFATGAASDDVTFVASSGDFGNECPATSTTETPGVNYPASDPNVVGVGGNESESSLTNPVAWNHSFAGLTESATGGGVSTEFTLPSFQSGVTGTASSSTYRNVPDIALPSVNVAVYESGSWQEGVGTSWSAPEFAAMMAEINQYCGFSQGSGIGNAATLYTAFAAASSDFIDVTSGSNQYNGNAPAPYYSAGTGYDNTTGLGLPIGISIAQSACGATSASGHRARSAAARHSGRAPASVAIALSHPTDRAFSLRARPAVLRSAPDLGERSSAATMRVQVELAPGAARMGGDSNVAAILRANGFSVTKTFRNHLIVDAQGTTAQVERLFATSIHNYAQWQHGTRYAPTGSITVPADLAPFVSGVLLNNAVTKHTPQRGLSARAGFRF